MKKLTLLALLALITVSCSSEQEKQEQKIQIQKARETEMFKKKQEELLKGVELSKEELEAEKDFNF